MISNDDTRPVTLSEVWSYLKRCWPFYRPQTKHLLAFISLTIFSGVLVLGSMILLEDLVYNKLLQGEKLQSLQASILFLNDSFVSSGGENEELLSLFERDTLRNRMIIGGAVWVIVVYGSIVFGTYYMIWIFQRVNQQLRVEMLSKAEHLSLRYHSSSRTGDLIYRVYQDSATITNILQYLVLTPLRVVGWIFFASLVLLFFSPWFGLIIFVIFILMFLVSQKFVPIIRDKARLSRELNSALTSRIQENLAASRVVKANSAEEEMMRRFSHDSKHALNAAFEMRLYISVYLLISLLLSIGGFLVAEYFMAMWSIIEKSTYLGGVVAFVGFAAWNLGAFRAASAQGEELASQVWEASFIISIAQDLIMGLRRAFYILDLEPEVKDKSNPEDFPETIQTVSFENVAFSYEKDHSILSDISLEANFGTITAIVGGTGSGKSTLLSLLLRLYDPDKGTVLINGIDIRDFSTSDLRAKVSIALQQNVLFAKSVKENIAYGLESTTDSDIIDASKIACAHDFINEMPSNYETELGERGGKLSTGQRQRLSIARALLKNTPILILDEPTASLDAETEKRVMSNIAKWGQNRIIFVITHRLSTIKSADRIAVLDSGVIKEFGSHQDLMELKGDYAEFVKSETGED
ncbi:MAG: ABC transporter ATP-binding protein [Porticoccaceae bacterium]|nr:ABC transporter ATP-binding protein [Porticoccaceae bacterium]